MLIANELELEELTNKLEIHFIETEASWLKHIFPLFIIQYPNIIFKNSDFTLLPESALISLLKRNDLQIDEIKIWDYVIKWGISQNHTLPKNIPFKKILDKQLWKDLTRHLISPDRSVNSIILSALIQELPIDRKPSTYSLEDIPYEFQRILRGTWDANTNVRIPNYAIMNQSKSSEKSWGPYFGGELYLYSNNSTLD
ncbi:hypothetical protein Glove_349g100 [Diversispora epigaea]|uniref:BACK domain-containing protein n=1 Tax=Diversispora epigaea TaxID=1348612 RepID=A0A397HEL6_9GLOM|nr:hypothetical protein Glove_349g100 [Diversispora epigaea]